MRSAEIADVPLSVSGINDIDSNGFTSLQIAVLRCDLKKVESLVKGGANCNYAGSHGKAPIFLVADNFGTGLGDDNKRLEILKFLLNNGANPSPLCREIESWGVTAKQVAKSDSLCHIAVAKRDPRLLTALLQHNIETEFDMVGLDVADECGVSPIELASQNGNSEAVKNIISNLGKRGCSVSQKSLDEALYYTCKILTQERTDICGKWQVVEFLINAGANPRKRFEESSAKSILDKHHCERGEKIKKIISENEGRTAFASEAEETKGDSRSDDSAAQTEAKFTASDEALPRLTSIPATSPAEAKIDDLAADKTRT
jgi:ankyrin repeat protein